MKVTEGIALEHATLLRVFDQVERVLPRLRSAAEVGTLATILAGLLRTHAELEFKFALMGVDDATHHKRRLAALHQERRELNERLREVQEAPTCARASGLLRAAMGTAREHFRDEERNLFPAVERALGLGVLAALGEAFKKATRVKANGAEQAAPGL